MYESWVIKKILRAFENRDVGSIQTLILQQHISPNALIPSKGVSPLHLIIGHQSETFAFKITKLFLRCGGDPNVQSSDGVTPTHVAAAWGRNRILHLLLVSGGDPWMQDDEKKNAFNYAFEQREWNTIELLHHFHQMYSAATCRQDIDPKFEINLERILLRKGEDIFAYTPSGKLMKSMMTQTQNDFSGLSSPVQNKIKYFDPNTKNRINDTDKYKADKENIGWLKDFYQTSCKVIVCCNDAEGSSSNKEQENKETFVSSIHIDTSASSSDSPAEKLKQNNSSLDVRSQLFVELQEAVRRRSKLKMTQEEEKFVSSNSNNSSYSNSVLLVDNQSHQKNSFITTEIPCLEGSQMLKNTSDFASKVMEDEMASEEKSAEKTIDLCISKPELTNSYLSCDEDLNSKPIQTFSIPQNESENSNVFLTPYNSNMSSHIIPEYSGGENSNESFVSVSEEYRYTDVEEGVVLMEKKLLVTPTISIAEEAIEADTSTVSSTSSSIPSGFSYNSDILRNELKILGYNPGPVTKTTKKLYLKKLWKLKKKFKQKETRPKESSLCADSPVVQKTLKNVQCFEKIPTYEYLEEEIVRSFENWTKKKWREGNNKTSFNYILLDPRLSQNLPKRACKMPIFEVWKIFLSSIFYIGKGKRSRPYFHFYQAVSFFENPDRVSSDEKTEKIVEIWKEDLGVVCLQVFQNIIPVEAFTREAAMVDAIGLKSLKNSRGGEYYGVASTWRTKEKINLGIYFLYKAMLIFLNEGERQIKPFDID